MARKLFCFLVIVGLLLCGAVATAQPPAKPSVAPKALVTPKAISPAVIAKLDPAGIKLAAIEGRVKAVETRKLITVEDSEQMGDTMYKYAEEMYAAFEAAIKEAEAYAKSEGKEGNIQSLVQFEKTAKIHETRLKNLEPRMLKIQDNVKKGVILADKPLLQKLSKPDLAEFDKFLAPAGRQKMRQLHPQIFKPLGVPRRPGASLGPSDIFVEDSFAQADSDECFFCSLPEKVGLLFVSPAEAGIAAGCIGDCLARRWSACASCLVNKGPQARQCWNTFVSRWNGCGKCWKFWTWWCKTKALGKLIWCIG